jgi:hypothetical protein
MQHVRTLVLTLRLPTDVIFVSLNNDTSAELWNMREESQFSAQ